MEKLGEIVIDPRDFPEVTLSIDYRGGRDPEIRIFIYRYHNAFVSIFHASKEDSKKVVGEIFWILKPDEEPDLPFMNDDIYYHGNRCRSYDSKSNITDSLSSYFTLQYGFFKKHKEDFLPQTEKFIEKQIERYIYIMPEKRWETYDLKKIAGSLNCISGFARDCSEHLDKGCDCMKDREPIREFRRVITEKIMELFIVA